MSRAKLSAAPQRVAKVSFPGGLLQDEREPGYDMPQACERHVTDAHRQRWLEENPGAIDAWNEHVARYGQQLAAFRQF